MNVPPSTSNVKKKKYPQVFYEIMVSLIIIFPQLIAYYALASLFVLPLHASNISISVWRVIIRFESYVLGFIFTCSAIFTAAIIFFTFKLPTAPPSVIFISVIKQYLFIFLWLSLAMIGYNINFLVLSVSTMVIIFPSFVFPFIADFVILLFLVMNAYAIGFWILARHDRFWVFESSSVNDGLKQSLEFLQGKYVSVCVVMTGFLAICCVIESPHKVLVIMFMSGIMAIVAVIINLVKKLLLLVWMDNVLEN